MRRLARPLMYAGVAGIVLGLSKYHADYVGDYDFTGSFRFIWALALVAIFCVAAYGVGLPEMPRSVRSRTASAAAAAIIASIGISTVQLFVGDALLPRFVVFGSACMAVPWFDACSRIAFAGKVSSQQRDAVVIVGPLGLEDEIESELSANPEKPASIVGHLTETEAAATGWQVRPLVELVEREGGSVVVLSATAQAVEEIVRQAAVLHEAGVRVRTQSLFYEEWLGKIPVRDLGRTSLFFDIGEVHRLRFGRVKRLVDLCAAAVGVVVFVAVIPLVVVGNAVANRGPLFYSQDRVGRGGCVFRILKFRSMRATGPARGDWTVDRDPRVTPFGNLLRRSHVDELPQVWNILKGDLSLVGPRPEQPRYVSDLVFKLPFYDLRHTVRPGLTGWAQVKYGYAGDEQGALEKLQYDFHYLRRQSFTFDMRIIGRTIRAVVGGEGRGR